MNQIEINKIEQTNIGDISNEVRVRWEVIINSSETRSNGITFTPSQMKELKEKMDKLEI